MGRGFVTKGNDASIISVGSTSLFSKKHERLIVKLREANPCYSDEKGNV
jgi:hypothetical protein